MHEPLKERKTSTSSCFCSLSLFATQRIYQLFAWFDLTCFLPEKHSLLRENVQHVTISNMLELTMSCSCISPLITDLFCPGFYSNLTLSHGPIVRGVARDRPKCRTKQPELNNVSLIKIQACRHSKTEQNKTRWNRGERN